MHDPTLDVTLHELNKLEAAARESPAMAVRERAGQVRPLLVGVLSRPNLSAAVRGDFEALLETLDSLLEETAD